MPLSNDCSDAGRSAMIVELIDSGKTQEQAVAIVMEHCGKSAAVKSGILYRANTGGLIKAVTSDTFEGYLVRFGRSDDRDLDREWFSAKTYFMLNAGYPIKGAPSNYQHGMDHTFGNLPIGMFTFVDEDEIGLFVRAQLHMKEQYVEMLRELGRVKGIKLSDGDIHRKTELAYKAVNELVHTVPLRQSMGADIATFRIDEDSGHIDQCGIVHGALTPTPSDDKNPLVRFKSALDSVYDLRSTTHYSIPEPVTTTSNGGVTINVYSGVTPNAAIEPVVNENPAKSAPTGTTTDRYPSTKLSTEDRKHMKMSAKLKALTPEEAQMLKDELVAALDGILSSIGMPADETMMAEMTDEMEDNLAKQDGDIVEEAAAAVAADVADVSAGDAPLTEEVVAEIVAENLEAILPEEVKKFMGKNKARNAKRDEAVAKAVGNAPAQSRKSQVGGFTNKAWNIVGRAEAPSFGNFIKSAADGKLKAQNPYIGTLGGYLTGQEIAQEILEPLRAQVVMFDMGVRQTTVNNIGIYTVPKMTTAPTAYRPGINQEVTESEANYDTITAYLRPIAAQVIIPRQMLMTAQPGFDQQIRDQMIRSIRLQIDKEILVGVGTVVDGTGAEIKGILRTLESHSTLASTNVATLATNGRVPAFTDLTAAETQIATGNVPLDDVSSGWVMHPRTRGSFRSLTTTTGEPLLFDNYGQKPYQDLIGYKVGQTTQVPINITTGTSTDTSYLFLGNYFYSEYVMANDIEIIVDEVTLMNKLQVRIIAYTYSDFIVHYPEAFYVMKGVRAS